MRQVILTALAALLCACQMQQPPQNSQFGNDNVYTTPGGVGGVSYTKYEVTPL